MVAIFLSKVMLYSRINKPIGIWVECDWSKDAISVYLTVEVFKSAFFGHVLMCFSETNDKVKDEMKWPNSFG